MKETSEERQPNSDHPMLAQFVDLLAEILLAPAVAPEEAVTETAAAASSLMPLGECSGGGNGVKRRLAKNKER